MNKLVAFVCLSAASAAVLWAGEKPPADTKGTVTAVARPAVVNPPQPEPGLMTMEEKLARRITLEKGFDPNTPLQDALERLTAHDKIPFVVDAVAFENVTSLKEVETQPIRLGKLKDVRLATALDLLLDQVNGTWVVAEDHICVVPKQGVRVPIDAAIVNRPLSAALRDLAFIANQSVVLDVTQEEAREQPVTASFKRVPLDTAVAMLANMVELECVSLDGVLYVTRADKAEEITKVVKNLRRPQPKESAAAR